MMKLANEPLVEIIVKYNQGYHFKGDKNVAMMVDIMSDSSNSHRISNPGHSFSAPNGSNISKNIDDQAQDNYEQDKVINHQ